MDELVQRAHAIIAENAVPLWLFPLCFIPAGLLLFPLPVLALVGTIAYGTVAGVLFSVFGIGLAALAGYLAGSSVPERYIDRGLVKRIAMTLRDNALIGTIGLRLMPTPPFTVTSLTCGAVRVPIGSFLAGSLVGIAPITGTTIALGKSLESIFESWEAFLIWAMGAVIFMALAYKMKKSLGVEREVTS